MPKRSISNAKSDEEKPRSSYTYRLETYERHIELVYQAFTEYWTEAEWAAHQLEKHFGWAEGSLTRAAQLAVLLHDVGKLSTGWQGWVRKYQAAIDMPVEKGAAYAHTELKEVSHQEIEKKIGRRPWHAVEGAYAVLGVLWQALDENEVLAQAAYSAIARHHTAHSQEHKTYQLERDAIKHIAAVFQGKLPTPDLSALVGMTERIDQYDSDAAEHIIEPDENKESLAGFLAYLLIVRALRRADSSGAQQGSLPID